MNNNQITLGNSLARGAFKHPDKKAVQDDRAWLSYAKLNERVNRLANVLTSLGMERGDRLATLGSNSLELIELFFACLKSGIIVCPLDTRGTEADHLELLRLVEPRAFAFHSDLAGMAEYLYSSLPRDTLLFTLGESGDNGTMALGNLLKKASAGEPVNKVGEDDVAFILFTGGTTGRPKGVELTHRNLIWNAINVIAENRSPGPEACICYPMQIYHSGALSRLLATIYAGGAFIALPKFDPAMYLDALEREKGTFVVGNQAIWNMLLEENARRRRDASSVTSWLHAQGDITPDFHDRIKHELFPNADMYASYALTEASPGVTVLKPWDFPRQWPGIGRPYISVEVRLADEDNNDVPIGEVGQILVRGPNVMRGYFRNQAETAATLKEGWLYTGDMARADDLGYLYFVDRIKDVIKSGGLNVYAREVEEVIMEMPGVAEVAVIGAPHPKWGEGVRAIIATSQGAVVSEENVMDYCRRRLAGYKKPASVVFIPKLPRDGLGHKIKKGLLRELYGQSE